jgi:hypothetical protein
VQAVDSSPYASVSRCTTEGDGYTYQAPHNQRDSSRCKPSSGLGLGAGSTSSTNRVTKPNGSKRPQASGSGKDILVALSDNVVRVDDTKVACPVFKHHIMAGETPPCNGRPVKSMAEVRSHLDPDRTRIHNGYPAFIKQCSRCKDDFVEEVRFREHEVAQSCVPQNQLRGQIEVPWARLYLKLYPNANRVPLPCKFLVEAHPTSAANCNFQGLVRWDGYLTRL